MLKISHVVQIMATKMKKDNILVIGVNNIGVSIAVLLKRLGYSFFVSSTNSMKLRLFKEGLTPIIDKDLKTLYINENVSPKFIEHIDKQNDVVFVCEDNFNIVKFLEHNEVTFLVINILISEVNIKIIIIGFIPLITTPKDILLITTKNNVVRRARKRLIGLFTRNTPTINKTARIIFVLGSSL